jgi:hypothetical protein
MKNLNCEIKLLTSCQEHIPILAELWYQEISRHGVSNASIEKAQQKLIDHSNRRSSTTIVAQGREAGGHRGTFIGKAEML